MERFVIVAFSVFKLLKIEEEAKIFSTNKLSKKALIDLIVLEKKLVEVEF
jgi:hypothetical protein